MSAPPESPDHLTNGAWLPGRGGVLVWTPGAKAPEWQDARPTRCGSLTGVSHHRRGGTPLCDLCHEAQRYYMAEYKRAKRRAA